MNGHGTVSSRFLKDLFICLFFRIFFYNFLNTGKFYLFNYFIYNSEQTLFLDISHGLASHISVQPVEP